MSDALGAFDKEKARPLLERAMLVGPYSNEELLDALAECWNFSEVEWKMLREAVLIRLRVSKQAYDKHHQSTDPGLLDDIKANIEQFAALGARLGIHRHEWEDVRMYG
jgi:hypothetical protein